MKKSTIIKLDIQGFNKQAQNESPDSTADYILEYYESIQKFVLQYNWTFIKGIGDCVLISAETNLDCIEQFFNELSKKYQVVCHYRVCEYAQKNIKFGSYQCSDVFGKDINNLFLNDHLTTRIG